MFPSAVLYNWFPLAVQLTPSLGAGSVLDEPAEFLNLRFTNTEPGAAATGFMVDY